MFEIFGREHNLRRGWTTVGNQLNSTRITEKRMADDYNKYYPENEFEFFKESI